MNVFFLVLARDKTHVFDKINELQGLGFPFKIVCGEKIDHPNVIYQPARGKFAAINFGFTQLPSNVKIVAMNDVDTKIHNLGIALRYFSDKKIGLVFGTELVNEGPQKLFFQIFNPIRKLIPAAGSGELMLVRKDVLSKIVPIKACKAEDTLILFKVLEAGHKVVFCEKCYAETERTKTAEKEEPYKRKTVTGIYQAMKYSHPPIIIKLFYLVLPLASPILIIMGKKGYFWMRGILLGLMDYLRGDKSGVWDTDYLK
jgi:cellulose synthase/poly-beta-1,6-N-acetylglucosamine synthase-like glycosyltransferase